MTTLSLRFLMWTLLLAYIATVQAGTRSVTVDDTATNLISYSEGWNQGDTCPGCAAKPDKSKARDGTWHDGTESADRPEVVFFSFTFIGTSVEVFYIAIDLIGPWTTNTNVSYSIDGIQRNVTQRESTNQTDYLYNQSLFRLDGLTNVQHTVRVDIELPGVLLLDYLIYTEETVDRTTTKSQGGFSSSSSPAPSSSSSSASDVLNTNIGAIIGGVLSCVIVLVVISTLWYCLKRRRRRAQAQLEPIPIVSQVTPFHHPYPPAKLASEAPQHRLSNTHPSAVTSEVPSETLTSTLGISNGSSLSASGPHPPVPPRAGYFPSVNRNQITSPSVDEPDQQELVSRRYTAQTLPPPYSPNA